MGSLYGQLVWVAIRSSKYMIFNRNEETDMTKRQDVLDFGMTLADVYTDAPFHDDNWIPPK